MASAAVRHILTPRSRRPAFAPAPAFGAIHTVPSQMNFDDASDTPSPATPELGWAETPPATNDPRTPENGFDLDDGVTLPYSPLAARRSNLEENDVPELNFSQPDSDVPKHLLSELLNETSQSRRLFQNELSSVALTATSQLQPPRSSDNQPAVQGPFIKTEVEEGSSLGTALQGLYPSPSATERCNDTVGTHAAAGSVPSIADSIKTEDPLVISDEAIVTESQTSTTSTTPIAAPSPCSAKKQPLTLSAVWALNTKLSTILPLEAVERFQANPLICISTTQAGSRCKRSIAATSNDKFVTELFKALSSLECSLDFGAFVEHMAPLIESVTCTRSHREPSRNCLKKLCSYSWQPREIATTNAHQAKAIANSVDAAFKLWISALIRVPNNAKWASVPANGDTNCVQGALRSTFDFFKAATEGNHVPCRHASPKATATSRPGNRRVTDTKDTGTPETTQQMTDSKPVRLSTHLNHRLVKFPYAEKKRNAPPQELIRQTLVKPLTPADMRRSGFIYVFWHPGSFRYVKIGYTVDIKKRLQDWKRQCGFDLEQHKSQESRAMGRVLHLHRVESLIHAELKEYRMFEPSCTGCGKSHLEWFDVDPSYALKVVAKWTSRSFYSGGLEDSISKEEIEKLCELTSATTSITQPLPKKTTRLSKPSNGGHLHGSRRRH